MCFYQKQNLWFPTTKYLQLSLLPQNYVSKNNPLLPQIFPFWVVPSHIIIIQNQQKFKTTMLHEYSLFLDAMFIQIM
jgi:hypothetical protein